MTNYLDHKYQFMTKDILNYLKHLLVGLNNGTYSNMHVFQALGKDVAEVSGVVGHSQGLLKNVVGLPGEKHTLMKDTLNSLSQRLETLDSTVKCRCESIRSRMKDLTDFQVKDISFRG